MIKISHIMDKSDSLKEKEENLLKLAAKMFANSVYVQKDNMFYWNTEINAEEITKLGTIIVRDMMKQFNIEKYDL